MENSTQIYQRNQFSWMHLFSKASLSLLCGLIVGLVSVSFALFMLLQPIPALKSTVTAKVLEEARNLDIVVLDEGRFRIAVKDFKGKLELKFDTELKDAKVLMIRRGYDPFGGCAVSNIRVSIAGENLLEIRELSNVSTNRFSVPINNIKDLNVTIEALDEDEVGSQLIIDEIGVYETQPNRFKITDQLFVKKIVRFFRIAISLVGICLLLLLPKGKAAFYGSAFIFVFAIATFCSSVFVKFSPEWSKDLKVNYASGALQNGMNHNYFYGLHMATSILDGKGPLVDGMPPWCRMPGYGFLFATLGGEPSYLIENLLNFAIKGVWFHVLLISGALAFFFWAALRITSPVCACAATCAILLLPTNIVFNLLIESIMPAVALFCLATSCLFYGRFKINPGSVSLPYHILLHCGFALWFFMRTDILPAWVAVSAILYLRNLRTLKFMLIPISFVLTIGISWAIFKLPYTGEFSMTTESVGASFMGGLWEVPHKFIWEPNDVSYYTWMEMNGQPIETKAGSDFAAKECIRFCFTFPFYVISLMWHKFNIFINIDNMTFAIVFLLIMPVIALAIKYKRMQTLLLGWPIFFNLPIFFIFYSSGGRFYDPAFISIVVTSFLLLFDREFYSQMTQKFLRTGFILLFAVGLIFFGTKFDEYLIRHDELRYLSPFLDPKNSTLNVVKK